MQLRIFAGGLSTIRKKMIRLLWSRHDYPSHSVPFLELCRCATTKASCDLERLSYHHTFLFTLVELFPQF